MPRSVSQQVAIRTRQAQAVELRRDGNTYADIAAQLGYSDASAARKAVRRAVQEIGQEEARTLLALQRERYDELLAQTWPVATDASNPSFLRAINTTLKIMERMDALVMPNSSKQPPHQDRSIGSRGQIRCDVTTVIDIQSHSDKSGT